MSTVHHEDSVPDLMSSSRKVVEVASPAQSGYEESPSMIAMSPSVAGKTEDGQSPTTTQHYSPSTESPVVAFCAQSADSSPAAAPHNPREVHYEADGGSHRSIVFTPSPSKDAAYTTVEAEPTDKNSDAGRSEEALAGAASTTVVMLGIDESAGNDQAGCGSMTVVVTGVVAVKGVYAVNAEDNSDNCGGDGQEGEGDPLLPADLAAEQKPLRSAFFTMFPVFMAYASLVTLQGDLKTQMGIEDGTEMSNKFSFATSLCYLGNLIFRLMHNILFSMFTPRQRVYIAYLCLITSVSTIAIVYYWVGSKDIGWLYAIYLIGGVGIGTFESNLISVITPLGHGTKKWAQMGIPLGFNGVSVGAFILFSFYPQCSALQGGVYSGIAIINILGLVFFKLAIPDIQFESSAKTLLGFWEDCKHWKDWVPKLGFHSFSLMIDMFCVSFISAVQQFIYTSNELPLFTIGPLSAERSSVRIPKNVHRSLFNFASLVGDACGRKVAYSTKRHVNPLFFLFFSALGMFLVLSKQSLLAPFGMLCIMFANGTIYAFTTKYIDDNVARSFNLVGLSFWLFIGDVGSFTGANVVSPVENLMGSE